MTTTRKFSQRLNGKLSKHTGYKQPVKLNRNFGNYDLPDADNFVSVRTLTPNPVMQSALEAVPGLQGRVPNSVDEIHRLVRDAGERCRQNKDGSPNRQDLKREMRKVGYEWEQGVYGWVLVDR